MLLFTQSTMWLAILLALCCLTSDSHETHSPDFCCKDLNTSVKPGFPKIIKTNDSEVLKAARHSVEKFNNSTNDIFLFKESRVSKALVQVRRTKSCHLRTALANWVT
ncbi:cystatin-F [Microtus ochrogaster]|uniref:Cystatin-F n=1 Tax=Microtus ochrogaster TaxID=79684 RepID=A0ABM1AYE9_MICOH|nr:cystatin-F [Microtus ochrogaster]